MGKDDSFLNFGIGGRSLMVCRVIFGMRCRAVMGGELLLRGAGVGGVIIVLILGCIPDPFIRKVVETFLERIRSFSEFST